ncbi:MAG: RIP metalloprotease RseP [Flavobacteriales bacterium]|nr:RIP metalloprotease RseP [Flavobacteriales bacterium]|tara:strand:+ start:384835 stop:386178 length:1344 start_codon:yes stop_codon:yes gene_type:complete
MEVILIKAAQLILSLSILIVLHELGHFIPARLFKTRVEKFYLFFDPWFSVIKKKIGDTEYGIGWLPLGGYVKISGMIDESMDKEQMAKPPRPWEFRSKPAWQRLIIMLGGVAVNLLLGIFIYSMILYTWGDPYIANKDLKNGLVCSNFAKEIGFKDGDKILSIDGEKIDRFDFYNKIVKTMAVKDEGYSVMVERNGVITEVKIGDNFIKHLKNKNVGPLFAPNSLPDNQLIVKSIEKNSNAESAGLLKGDIIVSVNDLEDKHQGNLLIAEINKNKNKNISLGVERLGALLYLDVLVSKEGTIGFVVEQDALKSSLDRFSLFGSIPAGYEKTKFELENYIAQFGLLFNSKNELGGDVGGFASIGNMFPEKWNWRVFWELTAFLSIMLAFLNLLPIPALDGGHVVFLLYEIIVGKPAPEKVMEYAQIVGFVLLMGLVLYANGNDIIKFF